MPIANINKRGMCVCIHIYIMYIYSSFNAAVTTVRFKRFVFATSAFQPTNSDRKEEG